MRTVESRLYTNVILTVIAALLVILAFQPVLNLSTEAHAQDRSRGSSTIGSPVTGGGDVEVAAATREVAKANQAIADAIKESAKAQADMARAVSGLAKE